jgi:hypothetical protein
MSISKITRAIPLLAAAAILLLPLAVQAAKPSGGGGNKVSVTAANPSDAFQGEELDVVVSGSGFDAGSQVSFLVTGTTDASQVEVLSVEYISSTELKTRIRPKDAALPSEYDIQVQTSSGRKGKGTTLFRVKVAETACTGSESKEPEIAYLTGVDTAGDLDTQDIYLSSGTGCDQYLLVEDAALMVPDDGDPKNGFGEVLAAVTGLRVDVEARKGIVIWRDTAVRPIPLLAVEFDIDAAGSVIVDSPGPALIHLPQDDYNAYGADVRIGKGGEVELITVEYSPDKTLWRLVYVNATTGERIVLTDGNCPFEDSSGQCFRPSYTYAWWNESGTEVYFNPTQWPDANSVALARIKRISGEWGPVEILMVHNAQVNVIGIRSDGLLAYEWLHYTPRRNGRTDFNDTYWVAATIDPELCVTFECSPTDGLEMAADANKYPRGWTRSGGMLFIETGPGAQRNIWEYSDPFTGAVGSLRIENVDRFERDTSY